MREQERAQVTAATETLGRVRQVKVRFTASWTRLDDLDPDGERSLREALASAWDTWAAEHEIRESEVKGPEIAVHKLDYFPSIGGDFQFQ